MNILKALFSEAGDISMIRLMSLLSCLASIVIAIVGLNKPTPDYSGLALLCSVFLGAAFGGKVAQKSLEVKDAKIVTKAE